MSGLRDDRALAIEFVGTVSLRHDIKLSDTGYIRQYSAVCQPLVRANEELHGVVLIGTKYSVLFSGVCLPEDAFGGAVDVLGGSAYGVVVSRVGGSQPQAYIWHCCAATVVDIPGDGASRLTETDSVACVL